jgi:hypothetical protein
VLLATIEGLVVAAKVRVAEGIAIRSEGPERWVIAWSVVEVAIALRMMTEAVVGVACAVRGAGTESLVIGSRDQGRNAVVGWGRWRCSVVGMRSAACCQEAGGCEKRKCNTREIHGVLTIDSRAKINAHVFEQVNAVSRKMLLVAKGLRLSQRVFRDRSEASRQILYCRVQS